MQRNILLLICTVMLMGQVVLAQNCPANPTYKNSSGTYNLSTKGYSYAVNNGTSVQVIVQNGFSSTSSICVTNGSTLNLEFQNINKPAAGGTIYVDATSNLNLVGSNMNDCPFVITNYGTVTQYTSYTFNRGGTVNNYGKYTSLASFSMDNGTVTLQNSGTMVFNALVKFNRGNFSITNLAGGNITFNGALTVASTSITNKSTLTVNGPLTLQDNTTLYNSGYVDINTNGTFTVNKASITNYGLLDVKDKILFNRDGNMVNYCTVLGGKDFTNNAEVTNEGSILLHVAVPGSDFLNQGTFINGKNGFVQGNGFHNSSGTVSGGGNFYFSTSTRNQSTFGGTAASYINFYDATPTGNAVFDVTNTQPVYTTKNPVLPLATTNLEICGEPTPPVILVQPQLQTFCDPNTATATFSVVAQSRYSSMTYQWNRNGKPVGGATGSSYTTSRWKLADTADVYTVEITNTTGTTVSQGASVHFIIVGQPSPPNLLLATGNTADISIKTSGAQALQWKKNGNDINNAKGQTLQLPVVNLPDSGRFYATVTYAAGTCISDSVILKPSIILYSKTKGNLNVAANWGVEKDGSGSTPVDFSREEHTFVVANRAEIATGGNIAIAGTLDVADGSVLISPGTTLDAGRIIRSLGTGGFKGSSTSSLVVHGIADGKYAGTSSLYFKKEANILQYLTTAAHTVKLQSALNITAGKNPGRLQVQSGTFETSDSLTLKSDSLGTAIVAESYGMINGKAIIERYMPARRAWRLMCAPITTDNAPTINTAWQEGATSNTDNPKPGYGTHITYGSTADGFDQNPQKTFSMYYYNAGEWLGVPATNKTAVTQYPAYLFFVRGDRSYDIGNTTSASTPRPTVLRTFGNFNQGRQAEQPVAASGFTLVANPYASPLDFEKIYANATNIKHTLRVWDPMLAGTKGVGAYVTLDWTGSGYKATPPSSMTSIIQPYQAFFVESFAPTAAATVRIAEKTKDTVTATNPFGRNTARETADAMLEIHLNVFNEDGTTGIADGVLYRFDDSYNNEIDGNDIGKLNNLYENLSITSSNSQLTIERRKMPQANETLQLRLSGTKTAQYQLQIIPQALPGNLYLYDKYLDLLSPINPTDTSRVTISINATDQFSKASDRFSIIVQRAATAPVQFSAANAFAVNMVAQVAWTVANEKEVLYYNIEKSADGISFVTTGTLPATGVAGYRFTDAAPYAGTSYYRVKSVNRYGKGIYTRALPVNIPIDAEGTIGVYPNPVTGKSFTVQLRNKKAGKYVLVISNALGQQVYNQTVQYNGGAANYKIQLKNGLPVGVYLISTIAWDGSTDSIKVIVQQ